MERSFSSILASSETRLNPSTTILLYPAPGPAALQRKLEALQKELAKSASFMSPRNRNILPTGTLLIPIMPTFRSH